MRCVLIAANQTVMSMIRHFSELRRLRTFEERYRYLRLSGIVGQSTFGYDRYLNQMLYRSPRWLKTRSIVIIRDQGCDLGVADHEISNKIIIHHMNPITSEDIENDCDEIYDPNFLVCTSYNTHQAIHFGDERLLLVAPKERYQYDTCPWKGGI